MELRVRCARQAMVGLSLSTLLAACVATPEQVEFEAFPSEPGELSLSATDAIMLIVSTEVMPVELAQGPVARGPAKFAGINDPGAVVEAFAAGFRAPRSGAGRSLELASLQLADEANTRACVTGRTEPEAQSGIVYPVVDVNRPECASAIQERGIRYIGLVGGAVVTTKEEEASGDSGGLTIEKVYSHTFWISVRVLDAGTGSMVCARSQFVDVTSETTVGILVALPVVLRWSIDAPEYWKAAAWRAGFDAGGCFQTRE